MLYQQDIKMCDEKNPTPVLVKSKKGVTLRVKAVKQNLTPLLSCSCEMHHFTKATMELLLL